MTRDWTQEEFGINETADCSLEPDVNYALKKRDKIIADLQAKLTKAIEGYHWIAEKNRFADFGSKNKATVMLSILEPKPDKPKQDED